MHPDKFGYRARIGLVYIASSIVMEPECYAMCPPGVSVHTTRIPLGPANLDNLLGLANSEVEHLLEATRLLVMAPLQSIVFACTAGSFIGGLGYDERVIERMREVSKGIPVTTTSSAVVKAFKALGSKKLVVVTPYTREVTDRAVVFLQQHGFSVLNSSCFGYENDLDMGFIPPERVYEMARLIDTSDADGVFLSCTNLRAISIIDELERDLGKPVVSSNQASFWYALRLAGIKDIVQNYGRLMRC
jgi:maleate isomerase